MDTQRLFEQRLEQVATDHDLRLAIDRAWANSGTYRFLPKEGFTAVLTLDFNWQPSGGYVTFTAAPSFLSRTYSWPFDELDDVQREIVRFLRA